MNRASSLVPTQNYLNPYKPSSFSQAPFSQNGFNLQGKAGPKS